MRSLRRHSRTARLFIFDLVTISIGLLIALGIDSLVEWRQQRNLAENAERSLRLEIRKNAAILDEALAEFQSIRQAMQASMDSISLLLKSDTARPSKRLRLDFKLCTFDQSDTPKVTPEQAAMLAERFGVWQLHTVILYNKARVLSALQHAVLEGKELEGFQVKDRLDGMELSAEK